MAEQLDMFHPSWYTADRGTPLWFLYTHHQWMRAVVVRAGKRWVVVEPAEGTCRRRLTLSWAEVRWHKPVN